MSTIEYELHQTLLDIAPESHDYEEQAMVVASATEFYRIATAQSIKTSSKKTYDSNKMHEARMMDALLQAMGRLASDMSDDEETLSTLDASDLNPEQIVHRASVMENRCAAKGFGTNMDILDDDDLSIFLNPDGGHDNDEYSINDDRDRHHPDLYNVPGLPRHWTDSRSNPVR